MNLLSPHHDSYCSAGDAHRVADDNAVTILTSFKTAGNTAKMCPTAGPVGTLGLTQSASAGAVSAERDIDSAVTRVSHAQGDSHARLHAARNAPLALWGQGTYGLTRGLAQKCKNRRSPA
jgi:hypothetical protein